MLEQITIPGLQGLTEKALQLAWWDGFRTGAGVAAIVVLVVILGLSRKG